MALIGKLKKPTEEKEDESCAFFCGCHPIPYLSAELVYSQLSYLLQRSAQSLELSSVQRLSWAI